MRVELRSPLRENFNTVAARLRPDQAVTFRRRCVLVAEFDLRVDGRVYPDFDRAGNPVRCVMYFADTLSSRGAARYRLAVIAHEIGHVMTLARGLSVLRCEVLADQFAAELGYPIDGAGMYLQAERGGTGRPAR